MNRIKGHFRLKQCQKVIYINPLLKTTSDMRSEDCITSLGNLSHTLTVFMVKKFSLLLIRNLSCFNLHQLSLTLPPRTEPHSVLLTTSSWVPGGCSGVSCPTVSLLQRGDSLVCGQTSLKLFDLQTFLHLKTMSLLFIDLACLVDVEDKYSVD